MKEKITFHTLVFHLLATNKYSEFEVPKYWAYFVQTMISLFQKKISVDPLFNYLNTISKKIDLIPMKFKELMKIKNSSIYISILNPNLCYQNYFPF
ncbi:CII-binding regulator of phage lambda lysogenization HflD [Flavobacterium sp. CG_23.5]|nr:CII-binding regulator of phage lambda lysogenization HflD [Flavobacterium sp. CG_9.10]MBP2282207.1 CII-binding regulator of phage lambda lysogenization HflD [Flavobacterium sp. CG_23.5]